MPGALVAAGERVALRTAERDDLPFLQRALTNPDLRYPLGSPVRSREEVEEWAFEGDEDRFVVCRDPDPVPGEPTDPDRIGAVNVEEADWRRPELTYWLVPAVHGEGYGREAVSLAVDYAFRTYDHPGIEAAAYHDNEASRGLLESLGFEQEGRLRKRRFVDGGYVDSVVYGLMRQDWER